MPAKKESRSKKSKSKKEKKSKKSKKKGGCGCEGGMPTSNNTLRNTPSVRKY